MTNLLVLLQNKRWTLLGLLVLVPTGFYSKFYAGPADYWVNNYVGGTLYVLFWSLLVSLWFPRPHSVLISLCVFLVTCLLEFAQLWHPPLLETLRGNFLARTVLGSTFSAWDFLYYGIGLVLSVAVLEGLAKLDHRIPETPRDVL